MVELFGGNQGRAQQQSADPGLSVLVKDIQRRIRVLEERYSSIRKNIQVNERNMLDINKRLMTELKTANMEIGEIKQDISNIKDEIQMIVKELKESVKKEEVAVLEKYIRLWEPLDFVTREEMEKYVESRR